MATRFFPAKLKSIARKGFEPIARCCAKKKRSFVGKGLCMGHSSALNICLRNESAGANEIVGSEGAR